MPDSAMWTMIVSLVILALAKTLQVVELKGSLKLMDEEFKRFLSEINALKKRTQETVSDIKKDHDRSIKEVTESYAQEIENLKKNMEHIKQTSFMLLVKRPKKSGS
jgi:gas vesicle protein